MQPYGCCVWWLGHLCSPSDVVASGGCRTILFSYSPLYQTFPKLQPPPGPIGPDPFTGLSAQTHLPLQLCTTNYAIPIMFILGPSAQTHLPLLRCTTRYVAPIMLFFTINHCNGATTRHIILITGLSAQTHLPLLRYTAKYAIPITGLSAQTHLPLPRCTASYAIPNWACSLGHRPRPIYH